MHKMLTNDQKNISTFDSSSLPSMLTDPLPTDRRHTDDGDEPGSFTLNIEEEQALALHPSTSQSVEHLNRRPRRHGDGAQQRHPSKRGRKRRRIHSDTDLSKMR
jgi:hypothetical protein